MAAFGRTLPDGALIGESWEVADLADDAATSTSSAEPPSPSRATLVASGPFAGEPLSTLLAKDPVGLLGAAAAHGRFPLLVKLLDAREALSVQVHPTAGYAADRAGVDVKEETWVVLEAAEGAQLYLGVRDGATVDDLRATAGTPEIVAHLRGVPARVGAVHHVPAGTVHALGAGVVVAEVQTPSDSTFRLYDWTQELGRDPRPLHVDAALACIEGAWDANLDAGEDLGVDAEVVVRTPTYVLRRMVLRAGTPRRHPAPRAPTVARVVQVVAGRLDGDGFAWPLERGGVVLLPAGWSGELRAVGGVDAAATVLETEVLGASG